MATRHPHPPAGEYATKALQLTALVDRLAQVMDASYIPTWLIKPVARLHDRRPVDAIRDRDYRQVSRLITALGTCPSHK